MSEPTGLASAWVGAIRSGPAQLAVLAALVLNVTLPRKLTLGPPWLLPSLEGVLLLGLIVVTPHRGGLHHSAVRQRVAIGLIAVVSAVNLGSLVLLAHYLLKGGKVNGHALIISGVVLWLTNVLIFAVWFWETDRGGPALRSLEPDRRPDFLFPQMNDPKFAPAGWMPGFVDYLYTSFTNATAFSPTDTMPLTSMAKVLMCVQSLIALVTLALVVSRAVNIRLLATSSG